MSTIKYGPIQDDRSVLRNKFYFEVEVTCVKDIGTTEY